MKSIICNIVLLALLLIISAKAHSGTPTPDQLPAKSYFTNVKPVIDGFIDSMFRHGLHFTNFKQLEPNLFADATVQSNIYFLYDRENVYIAGELFQPAATIKSSAGRRDAPIITEGDLVVIAIDPLNNGNAANFFAINPSNGVIDGVISGNNWDFKWDGLFTSATKVHDDKWTFELHLPLSSINFQSQDEQTWGVLFLRFFANRQEKMINQIVDKDNPTRVNDFYKIHGLKDLRQKNPFLATPYVFYSHNTNKLLNNTNGRFKTGGEIRWKPVPSMSVLATINPDFAQIETDRVIVNVDDVPVSLPERRPFFTESSDLYPGLAVNTRNIKDIDAGMKVRQVINKLKYDVTWVLDNEKSNWYLANARWTNNQNFHAEVISGIKNTSGRTDYNVTTNLRTWAFNRRLTAYNWFGTINRPQRANEFETVNSIQWNTRELNAGVWSHVKSGLYNPNVIGHNTLSNEIILSSWINYTIFSKEGLLRQLTGEIKATRSDLYTHREHDYTIIRTNMNGMLNLGNKLGNWNTYLQFQPAMSNYFRYRNLNGSEPRVYTDAYSTFTIAEQNRAGMAAGFSTDYSKKIGFNVHFNNYEVRKSTAANIRTEVYWKITGKTNLTYSLEHVKLNGSVYQQAFSQSFHRLKLEHNVNSKINIRAIAQLNNVHVDHNESHRTSMPLLNITGSWEYSKGSFIYVVFNRYTTKKKMLQQQSKQVLADEQMFAIKINKSFSF